MMSFKLFDYRAPSGQNDFKAWTKTLQPAQRSKLNAKLDMLKMLGDALLPQVLTGTDTAGIYKLRVKGNVQLRPMLCSGPINVDREFTLLLGAVEVGGTLKPKNAAAIAAGRKDEVRSDPDKRRIDHERVS
ncbi:MAG: hypothetical protein A2040_12770 [Rhodocyclales bacterium GWA2_65_19]|nr:MAG: hypothetical protein A2040_12770 [Rhodocyclales bacterium GWA2_65_19]